MIKTKDWTVEFEGRHSEIIGDIYAILEAARLKAPMELYVAFELFSREDNKEQKKEEKDTRLRAFAAVLAAIPEEEREKIKEQLLNNKEGKHDGTNH